MHPERRYAVKESCNQHLANTYLHNIVVENSVNNSKDDDMDFGSMYMCMRNANGQENEYGNETVNVELN
jgi:hypothetical protein